MQIAWVKSKEQTDSLQHIPEQDKLTTPVVGELYMHLTGCGNPFFRKHSSHNIADSNPSNGLCLLIENESLKTT